MNSIKVGDLLLYPIHVVVAPSAGQFSDFAPTTQQPCMPFITRVVLLNIDAETGLD